MTAHQKFGGLTEDRAEELSLMQTANDNGSLCSVCYEQAAEFFDLGLIGNLNRPPVNEGTPAGADYEFDMTKAGEQIVNEFREWKETPQPSPSGKAIIVPKITPGEWRVRDGRKHGIGMFVDAPECMVENRGSISYAQQILEDGDYETKEADTCLIGVAPNMRALLLTSREAIGNGTFSPEEFTAEVEKIMQKSIPLPVEEATAEPHGRSGPENEFAGFDPRP